MINTESLEKCIRIISYWTSSNEEVIKELLKPEQDLITDYAEPFEKELNKNLLNVESTQAKIDILKYYVFEFWELQSFFKEHQEILFEGVKRNYNRTMYELTNAKGVTRKLNEYENYVINSHELFLMIFDRLQIAAIKYGIDFDKICSDLKFDILLFDSGITLGYRGESIQENQRNNINEKSLNKSLYDIALSFAGEDRDYVEEVAKELKQYNVSVFYDSYEQANLWGKDLYQHLNDVYKNKCKYCIIFISSNYAKKLWTRHELQSAQARAFTENYEYILPVRFDDTEIPGVNSTVSYLDGTQIAPQEIVLLIMEKLK